MNDGEEITRALSTPTEEGAARKKAKIEQHDLEDLAARACGLYRSHLDSLDDDDNDHDHMSKIKALVQLIESNPIKPLQEPLSSITTTTDLLPVLASVAYFQMASTAIERYLEGGGEASLQQPQDFIDKSLSFFPRNAACWSMGANFGRITETLSTETVTQWYQQAAQHAHLVRQETLELLERDYDDESVKEWMELLLLQQVVGVEYILLDEQEEQQQQQDNNNDHDGYFSASSVEGTSRFMAAMLLSRDGHHDDAMQHLKSFSSLTHRLHPNVWTGQGGATSIRRTTATTTTTTTAAAAARQAPVSFRGVLPPKLYEQMCQVFAPDAAFWRESDYANRGYYSFLADTIGKKPKNLIDDVVINHLLPLAKQILGDRACEKICAFEWWVHSRQASLGHTLHFDTDEASLECGQTVHHPLLSSVLHLTGDETSGATIVLDQTPDSSDLAQVCWRSVPHPNTFMVFPGNLLHGVLPCPGTTTSTNAISKQALSNTSTTTSSDAHAKGQWIQALAPTTSHHRLTFMVGFKTRHVPDQRQGQDLYGPCAPLPPDTEEWVKEIQRGYEQDCTKTPSREPRQEGLCMEQLPHVSPAWECIPKDDIIDGPPLQLPEGIDHRFFVSGAPECFRSSLFENDDGN